MKYSIKKQTRNIIRSYQFIYTQVGTYYYYNQYVKINLKKKLFEQRWKQVLVFIFKINGFKFKHNNTLKVLI